MAAITRPLAEMGADIVRIEPDGGSDDRRSGRIAGGVSVDFVAANQGKRAASFARLEDLAAEADILIAPPGKVDVGELHGRNPALVIMSVSDFGNTGRFAGWAGSGPVFHALSGELARSGIPGRPPLLPPGDLAIECAAAQAGYGVLVAYWQALKTGCGDHLDFSALDGAAHALDPGYGIAGSAAAGVRASELPRGRPEARFMYPILPCRDGFVRLCVLAPRQWRNLFEWMGRPAEFADPAFEKLQTRFASKTLLPAIAAFLATKSRQQAEEEGQRFGVPAAALLDLPEALSSPQMAARRAFVPVEIAPGLIAPFPDGGIEIDGVRMGIAGPAPALPHPDVAWRTRAAPPRSKAPPGASDTGERPFAGLKVLDFGVIVVGAECGRLLADQGADVIKIESSSFPDGSRQSRVPGAISPTFATGHRNKRSLGLDIRHPKGKAILLELVRQSDVLLSNFKGGTLESLGLDYPSLKHVNPRIIVADSSAFGPTGPWSKRMGYGPLVRASAGLTMQWRYPGEADSFSDAITVYPDHVAARIGIAGVIALLIRRARTGRGGQVSVSQAEVMLSQMAARIAADSLSDAGHTVLPDEAQSAVYECAGDDEWCVVTLRGARDAQAVARLTAARQLSDWCASKSSRAVMEELQAVGVAAGAMLRVSELPGFEYYIERRFFRQAVHPHMPDPFTVEAAPMWSDRLPDPPAQPAPMMGEHTTQVLREWLNMDDTAISALVAEKVLEQWVG
jgi:crotonobetainyl-CoA:carnitine CoA-transferase CaiB-like acyl-CoA transferase